MKIIQESDFHQNVRIECYRFNLEFIFINKQQQKQILQ